MRTWPGRDPGPAVLDRTGPREAPHGDEIDLRAHAVPPHLRDVRDAAVRAARQSGAKAAVGVWATGGGREGLWVQLHRPTPAAFDAAYDAVAQRAPAEAVTVLDRASLSREAKARVVRGLLKEPDVEQEGTPFTALQNTIVLVVCLVGAVLVVFGRERGNVALEAAGWAVEALLLVGVVLVAAGRGFAVPGLPRRGEGFRPVRFLLFLAVSAGLLWQAARGLS